MSSVHHPPNPPVLYTFKDPDALSHSLAHFIIKAQKESVTKKGRFTVAISGGSLPKMLKALIGDPSVKWDKWYVHILKRQEKLLIIYSPCRHVFYVDERVVPLDHPDSNYKASQDLLFSKVQIPK